MLRSNSKKARENIRAYILEKLNFSYYISYEGYPKKEPETWQDRVLLCRDIFREEYVYQYNLIRYGGECGCFREWLCGVPSAFNVDFSYYAARRVVRGWFEQTEKESEKYNDSQVWEKYLHCLTREFFAMVEKAEKEKQKKAV